MRAYYKTIITYQVLHEDPIPDDTCLGDIVEMCDSGPCVGDLKKWETKTVDGETMAKLLTEARSDPSFFDIDCNGRDLSDIEAMRATEPEDECPLCHNGTVEHCSREDGEWAICRGECGAAVPLEDDDD